MQTEQELLCAVHRALSRGNIESRKLEMLVERGAERIGQLGHRLERCRWILPETAHDLIGAVRRLVHALEERRKLVARYVRRNVEQVEAGHILNVTHPWHFRQARAFRICLARLNFTLAMRPSSKQNLLPFRLDPDIWPAVRHHDATR